MRTYQHSGAVPFSGALMTAAAGCLAALFLAVGYAFSFQYIPFVYLNLLLALGFGGGIGWTVGFTAREGKIRNVTIVGALAVVAAFIGAYVQWGATVYAACPPEELSQLWAAAGLAPLLPQNIFALMEELYAEGSWGLTSGSPVRGWPLAIVWVCEAGAILYAAFNAATKQIANQPYCEQCQEWVAARAPHLYLGDEYEAVWSEVKHGAFENLALTSRASGDEPSYMRLTLHVCEKCQDSNYLTIAACKNTTDSKGNAKFEEKNLFTNLAIQHIQTELIQAANSVAPAPGAMPESCQFAPPQIAT